MQAIAAGKYKAVLFGDFAQNNCKSIPISTNACILGNNSASEYYISGPNIESKHVKLKCGGATWTIATCAEAITNVTVNGLPLTTTGLPLPDGASVVFDNRLAFIFKTNYQEYIMQLNRAWARVSEQFAPEIGRLGPYEVEISYVRQLLATSNLNVHLVQLLRRMQYATDLRQMFDQIRCMLCGGHTIDKTFLLPCGKVVGFKCAKMCFLGGRCIGCCMPVVEVPALLRQMSGFIDDFVQRRRHVLGPIANNCCRLRSRTLPGEAIATRTVMAPMPGQRKRNNSF